MVLAAFFNVPIYLPSRFGLESEADRVARMPERCTEYLDHLILIVFALPSGLLVTSQASVPTTVRCLG